MRQQYLLSFLALATSALLATQAAGQTYTWTGGAFTGNMSDAANWSPAITPTSGEPNLKLIFPNTFSSANQNIATPLVLQDMQFNGFFNTGGNALQFDNLGANPTITSVSSNNGIFNNVSFVDPTTFSVTNGAIDLYGALSGGGGLSFGGSNGQVNLNGSGSTLTGTHAFNAGSQVNLSNANAIGGTLNVSGGTLQTLATGAIAAGTDVNVSSGGQVFNSAPSTVDDLDASGGNVFVFQNMTVTGNISSSSGANVIGQGSGSLAIPSGTTISVTSAGTDHLNINSVISTGSFTKTGSGKLVLGTFGTNTFSGTNTVSAGVLRGSSAAIGTVVNNSTVELAGGAVSAAQISGTGNVIITGGFADYNGAQTYAGTTTIDGGGLGAEVTTIPALVTGVGAGGSVAFEDVGNVTHTGVLAGTLFVYKTQLGVLTLGGNNPYSGGTFLGFGNGGLAITSDTAIGTGSLTLIDPSNTLEATGSRTLANPLSVSSGATFQGAGDFNFTDTTAKLLNGPLVHNSTGTTIIAGKHAVNAAGSITVNAGTLALGDGSAVNGFTSAGPITVNGGTLSLNSLNFINLPVVTLAGGTLNVPNGYAIPLGAVLQGNGGVTGRLATANGSTIIASGNLVLGDAAHPAGVNLDGELYTGANTVTLADSNQAVLGSITDLGTPSQNGNIAAPNGAVLNFGRNIIGRGQIQSNNTLADAVIVNGDVNGDSPTNYLEFTGYVKGVGTFNNVAFSGTFSPGLSPTLMTIGNNILTPSSILDMEIGGLARGGQYDAFDVTGVMTLGGTMKVSLINAFAPSLGNQFLLFQGISGGSFVGAFGGFDYTMAPLSPGLMWDTSLLYTNGILQVVAVPEPATLAPLAFLLGAAAIRRRRA